MKYQFSRIKRWLWRTTLLPMFWMPYEPPLHVLVSLTLRKHSEKLAQNMMQGNTLLARLKAKSA